MGGPFKAWRLDHKDHAPTWNSGVGAELDGGRWNPKGYPVVYCSTDPATAILEVAVHKGFSALDAVPHVLTSANIHDPIDVGVVMPENVPNKHWLNPGPPSAGQQAFGRDWLEAHAFVLIPSVVSQHSWNLLFNPDRAKGRYSLDMKELFALDTRLNRPK